MPFQSIDKRFEPESVQTRVLYHKDTGQILHVHEVVTVRGAASTSEEDVDARIRELAAKFGITADAAELLRVGDGELVPGVRFRVDPATRKLVRGGTAAGPGAAE